MENHIGKIKDAVNKGAPIRMRINQELYGEYKDLIQRFITLSGCVKEFEFDCVLSNDEKAKKSFGNIFKNLVDSIHYQGGGYPSAASLGKLESRLAFIGPVVYLMQELGFESNLETMLAEFGIKSIEIDKSFYERMNLSLDNKEDLIQCVKRGDSLQSEICDSSDSIKIDLYESLPIEARFDNNNPEGIKKSDFLKCVSAKTRKDIEKVKNKLFENVDVELTNRESFSNSIDKLI